MVAPLNFFPHRSVPCKRCKRFGTNQKTKRQCTHLLHENPYSDIRPKQSEQKKCWISKLQCVLDDDVQNRTRCRVQKATQQEILLESQNASVTLKFNRWDSRHLPWAWKLIKTDNAAWFELILLHLPNFRASHFAMSHHKMQEMSRNGTCRNRLSH